MGAYLSEPIVDKQTEEGEGEWLRYGATCMQGWRVSQEDAHNCIVDFAEGTALFGVYDGHGGAEVAQYISKYFPDFLKSLDSYKDGRVREALEAAFLDFDELLRQEKATKELREMAGKKESEHNSDEDSEDKTALLEDACTPLEQILKRYGLSFRAEKERLFTSHAVKKSKKFLSPNIRPKKGRKMDDNTIIMEEEQEKVSTQLSFKEENPPTPPSSPQRGDKPSKRQHSSGEQVANDQEPDPKRVKQQEETVDNNSEQKHLVNGSGYEESAESKAKSPKAEARMSEAKQLLSELGSSPSRLRSSKSESEVQAVVKAVDLADKNTCVWGGENDPTRASETPETATAASSSGEEDEGDEGDAEFAMETVGSSSDDESSTSSDTDPMEDEQQEDGEGLPEEEQEDEEEEMFQVPSGDTPGEDSGSTACVAVVRQNKLFVANAGDSRCVLSRAGKAVDLSQDHKPEDEEERQRIEAAGGKVSLDGRVNGGLNLSRALGDHFYKKNVALPLRDQMISALPDVRVEPLRDDDQFLVLACDGIWNSLTSQEVVDFVSSRVAEQKSLTNICEELCDSCLAANTVGDGTGCDNMTVVITLFKRSV